jgi:hypothetical protein
MNLSVTSIAGFAAAQAEKSAAACLGAQALRTSNPLIPAKAGIQETCFALFGIRT